MAIEQVGGGTGINYAQQIDRVKTNSNNTVEKESSKPSVNDGGGVQDKVEIKAKSVNAPTETEKIRDNNKAEALKESIKKQMEQVPVQAIAAQATNITPDRVANLL